MDAIETPGGREERVFGRSMARRPASLLVIGLAVVLSAAAGGISRTEAQLIPIQINRTAHLGFGTLITSPSAGTAVVTPAGARSTTGGVTGGSTAGVSGATFTVTGFPLATYSISLPGSASLTGPGSMTVDTFKSTPTPTGQISVLGSQTLRVGATLHIGALQAGGTYSGTFNVTVAYN